MLGVIAGTLVSAAGCGDSNPYSAEAIARAKDPVSVIITGINPSQPSTSDAQRAARAVSWLDADQKREFLSRGGLTSLLNTVGNARTSHDPLQAAATLLASVPAEVAEQRLRGDDAPAFRSLSHLHGELAISGSPAWSAFVSALPPGAKAEHVLNIADHASFGPTGVGRDAWIEAILATAADADPEVLIPGLATRLGPDMDSQGGSRPSPATVLLCVEVLGSLGEHADGAAVPLFDLWRRAGGTLGSGSSSRDPRLEEAAWTALTATKGSGFGLFLADAARNDQTLLTNRRVVKTLYELGRTPELQAFAARCLDTISPATYALALAQAYRDALPSLPPIGRLYETRSHPQVPSTLNEQQEDLARALCMEVARLDPAGWAARVVDGGAFRRTGTALQQSLRESATPLDPLVLDRLNRRRPDINALSSQDRGRLALAAANHVDRLMQPSESVLGSMLGALADYNDSGLADLFISALDAPFDDIQMASLRWMQGTLGPERATAAFFENFRNRDRYSRSQIDRYIDVLALLNTAEKGRFVAAGILHAIERAGSPDAAPWASKYIAIRTLERVGDERVIPTLRLLLRDDTSFVEIEGSRETTVRFAQSTRTAIAAIESRGAVAEAPSPTGSR